MNGPVPPGDENVGRESRRKKQAPNVPEASDALVYGFYLVAFLDLLGQTDELRRLGTLPHTADKLPEALSALKRTAGRVRSVRDAFENYLAAARSRENVPLNPSIAPEYRVRLDAAKGKFVQRGFSDCFVITTPLFGEEDPVRAVRDVYSVLFGIAGMSLVSMAQGKPLRGGIDIERGIEIYPGEVYGPGLLCAYELEKNEAKYPRVLVGSGLVNYLKSLRSLDASDRWLAHGRNMGSEVEQLICAAPDDGKPMVHMLSPVLMELGEHLTMSATGAYAWAKSERERFISEGNEKLATYYSRLVEYFDGFGHGENKQVQKGRDGADS
jgi:hypothetical protein